jgi:hypothetical protein
VHLYLWQLPQKGKHNQLYQQAPTSSHCHGIEVCKVLTPTLLWIFPLQCQCPCHLWSAQQFQSKGPWHSTSSLLGSCK